MKNVATKIRPFTEHDDLGSTFKDLEGREHQVELGRCFCVGVDGERWTCSVTSLERDRVSDPDAEGFCLYQQVFWRERGSIFVFKEILPPEYLYGFYQLTVGIYTSQTNSPSMPQRHDDQKDQ